MNEHRDRLSERAKQRKASKALRQLSSKVNRGLDLTDSEQFIVDKILAIEQGEDVSSKAQSEPVDSKPSEDVAAQTQAVLAEEPLFDLEAGYAWMKTLNKDNVLEELKADPNGFSSQQILDYDEEYRNALLKKLETLYQELYAEVVATAKEIDSDNFQNLEDAIDDFLWFNKDFESNQTLKVFESIINKLEQLRNLKLTNDKINELLEKHEGRVDG